MDYFYFPKAAEVQPAILLNVAALRYPQHPLTAPHSCTTSGAGETLINLGNAS